MYHYGGTLQLSISKTSLRNAIYFSDARTRDLPSAGLHPGQASEGASPQHQQPEGREAVVRRAAVRALGHQARRPLRHQQRARLRNARRRHEGGLRDGGWAEVMSPYAQLS